MLALRSVYPATWEGLHVSPRFPLILLDKATRARKLNSFRGSAPFFWTNFFQHRTYVKRAPAPRVFATRSSALCTACLGCRVFWQPSKGFRQTPWRVYSRAIVV